MNDIILQTGELATVEDVSRFVLVGHEKLNAIRAEIRAIEKVGLATAVRNQKLEEARLVAEAVLDAEVKLGQLMDSIPKASGRPKKNIDSAVENKNDVDYFTEDFEEPDDSWDFLEEEPKKPKAEVIQDLGFSQKQAERIQLVSKYPEVVEQIKAEAREHNDIPSRQAVLNKIKAEQKIQKKADKAERKSFELEDTMPECSLYCADIHDGLKDIPDGSVDFIITDPPYPKEYLPLYSDLSAVAGRILKENGSLLVMVGQSYLPEVIARLSENMSYHWCLAYMTPGGQSPQLFTKNVNTFWKPVLWFTKGDYTGDWIGDVLKSPVNDNDKRFHEWGQSLSGIRDIVERFTNPGDTILDPFLGGGTTGVAAVTMGRKFIGTDIEQKNVSVSEQRIKEAYAECLK